MIIIQDGGLSYLEQASAVRFSQYQLWRSLAHSEKSIQSHGLFSSIQGRMPSTLAIMHLTRWASFSLHIRPVDCMFCPNYFMDIRLSVFRDKPNFLQIYPFSFKDISVFVDFLFAPIPHFCSPYMVQYHGF